MVTVEVVARDAHGQPISGRTAKDFQIFEQIAGKHDQRPQKIAVFRAVTVADLAARDRGKLNVPPGVYTNFVTMDKIPVPPTVVLVDGINTDRASQTQVHRQTIKMLASLPDDVPVAVFLLARRLVMVQNFTTDPRLLKAAIRNVSSLKTDNSPTDGGTLQALLEDGAPSFAALPASIAQFEREEGSIPTEERLHRTADALGAISRHVAGYAGRKNLLWISSSFPIAINSDVLQYQVQMATVVSALAQAKLAVYPVDLQGNGGPADDYTEHSAILTSKELAALEASIHASPPANLDQERPAAQDLARQTGGTVCAGKDDLGDCVKKAINDGNAFYEIAYYPDSADWHGEFHKITVKSKQSGTHLAYRQGYYARQEGDTNAELQQAACLDPLTSTSVLMVAKSYPADKPGAIRYAMAIDPTTVTFGSESDGSRELVLNVGICTFDKTGKPTQFLQNSMDAKLTEKEFAAILAQHGFPHEVIFRPTPGTAAVRLLVRDVATGEMGSVNLLYEESAAAIPPPASAGSAQQPASH
jgi:VWFA-related protein